MLGTELEEVKHIQYLGIQLQQDLRWNQHTEYVTTKSSRVLNFIKRNFSHCTTSVKEKLYSTLVRPHLEYAAAAWDPHTRKNIDSIERVQKRAARFVSNTYGRDTSITAILQDLKWTPLFERRKCHRLTSLFKILNGHLDIKHGQFLEPKPTRSRRGHSQQFQQKHTKSEAFANSFFNRTIIEWNKLLSSTVENQRQKHLRTLSPWIHSFL